MQAYKLYYIQNNITIQPACGYNATKVGGRGLEVEQSSPN